MPEFTIFFDVDDTLYPPSTGIWEMIGERIDLFIQTRLKIPPEKSIGLRNRLFTTYGTTLRGLVEEYGIDRAEYLEFVHDVPVEQILQPDPALRELLLRTRAKKIVFTNADRRYATRVITSLGLDGCFSQLIDIIDIWPACKPQPEAFTKALALSGEQDSTKLILFDDTPANLVTAASFGFNTILVGSKPRPAGIHAVIGDIHDFPSVLPNGKS
jgi:pyrimidine 5'-nucleotidase